MTNTMKSIGTKTKYGIICAVGWVGERYYWIKSKLGTISMFPASIIEKHHD